MLNEVYSDNNWLIEYYRIEGGLLSFDNLKTGETFMVGIRSTLTDRCIVRGQFKSSLKSHGIDRTVDTFRKLAIK